MTTSTTTADYQETTTVTTTTPDNLIWEYDTASKSWEVVGFEDDEKCSGGICVVDDSDDDRPF